MTGSPQQPAATPRLNAIGIVVADMAAAVAFYSRLGLSFPDTVGDDHLEADLGGGVTVMLDTEASIRKIYPDWVGGPGRMALAAELPTPADVDACYAAFAADGFGSHEPWDAFWGQRYCSVRDPDGNDVDLYAALRPTTG